MTRGQASLVGDTRTALNGYHYTRTLERGWRLTHHIIAEKKLGREINSATETVRFRDGNRQNLESDNIIVVPKRGQSREKRIAELRSKIEDLQAQLEELESEAS